MSLESLLQDDYWEVYIQWTRPCLYERVRDEGSKYDNSAHLYYIRAKYSTGRPKVLYIGQTYQQSVSIRLGQPDHRKRCAEFTNSYPNHHFAVSHGIVSITYGNITSNRIDDIESLLIYANDPEHAYNVRNINQHGVKRSYFVTNRGYRSTLPRFLWLGLFAKY